MSETEVNEGGNGGHGGGIELAEIKAYFTPRSTIKIHSFQFLPGIVEFIARIALMVILLIVFATSAAVIDKASEFQDLDDIDSEYMSTQTAAAFALVGAFIAFLHELIFFIYARLLDLQFMEKLRIPILIGDMTFHAASAVWMFAVAISLSYYSDFVRNQSPRGRDLLNELSDTMSADAFFMFVSVFVFAFLIIWMILYLVLNWDLKDSTSVNIDDNSYVDPPTSGVTQYPYPS